MPSLGSLALVPVFTEVRGQVLSPSVHWAVVVGFEESFVCVACTSIIGSVFCEDFPSLGLVFSFLKGVLCREDSFNFNNM